jgi:hypothetical protein
MSLVPSSTSVPQDSSDASGGEIREKFGAQAGMQASSRIPESPESRRESVASDVSRLSVGSDGRLYWDNKPVVIRRRLLLTGWQTFAAIVVSLAAFIIAASGAVHVAINAHDWMCGANWITAYCVPATPSTQAPAVPPPRPELPN